MSDQLIPGRESVGVSTVKIFSDGTAISEEYNLLSVTVRSAANRIGTAELVFLDGDPAEQKFLISDSPDFAPGKTIKIEMGYDADESPVFEGIVVKHGVESFDHKPSMLKIVCKDQATKLTVSRKSAYYYKMKDSEIIEEVIRNAGLDKEVASTTLKHDEVVQFYATDWDFLLSRAEVNGLLVFTEGSKITVAEPQLSGSPVLTLSFGGNMMGFEAEFDARYQYAGAKGFAWDSARQEMLEIAGNNPSESFGGLSPSDLSGVLDLGDIPLKHAGQLKDQELTAWADALLLKSRLAMIRGRVSFEGSTDVKPGDLVELSGVGEKFNGLAYVSAVLQAKNTDGWHTDVELGLPHEWCSMTNEHVIDTPANGLLPAVNGLQIGLVTKLEEDPNGEDRVQVRIPMIDPNAEGVWARVSTLDAGNERGSFFRPEIGDEVLLGFLNDDPRNPVILGMMNSSNKPAPITALDTNHIKGFYTREKMKIEFDDENKIITIETPKEQKIVINDSEDSIVITDKSKNTITMSSDGIILDSKSDIILKAAAKVAVESGANTEIKAGAQFKAEGSAGAELKTSAIATVKGSLVKIN